MGAGLILDILEFELLREARRALELLAKYPKAARPLKFEFERDLRELELVLKLEFELELELKLERKLDFEFLRDARRALQLQA